MSTCYYVTGFSPAGSADICRNHTRTAGKKTKIDDITSTAGKRI